MTFKHFQNQPYYLGQTPTIKMLSTQKHSGVNAWGYNPKSYRKFRRNLDELHANPVPKGEDYWKSFWAEESAKDDWTAAPVPKSKEQLLKEEIEKNLEDWPWKGVPQKLLTVVCTSHSQADWM